MTLVGEGEAAFLRMTKRVPGGKQASVLTAVPFGTLHPITDTFLARYRWRSSYCLG